LAASPDKVWALIGDFGAAWEPLIATINTAGTGIGQIRVIEMIDGKRIVERLEEIDNSSRSYRYAMLVGLQVTDYTGTLSVAPKGTGSLVQWQVQYWADGQPDIVIKTVVTTLLRTSLESLKARFGAS
jgi:hypothetical protein